MSADHLSKLVNEAISVNDTDPYDLAGYCRVIEYAKEHSLLDSPMLWICKLRFEVLKPEDVIKWASATERGSAGGRGKMDIGVMWKMLSDRYPTLEYVLKHVDFLIDNPQLFSEANIRCELYGAYQKFRGDFVYGQLVFDRLISFLTDCMDWQLVRTFYKIRLEVPHRQARETYQAYSSFMSAHFSDDYTDTMREGSRSLSEIESASRYYEMSEQAVASDPDNPAPWLRYINMVNKFSVRGEREAFVLAVFYRSLYAGSRCKLCDPLWFEIWLTVLRCVEDLPDSSSLMTDPVIALFMNSYPDNPCTYFAVAWLVTSEQKLRRLRQRVIDLGLFKDVSEDCVVLAKDLVTIQNTFQASGELSQEFIADLAATCEAFPRYESIVRLCVRMHEETPHPQGQSAVTLIARKYFGARMYNAQAWVMVFDIYDRNSYTEELRAFVKSVDLHIARFDDPWAVYSRLEMHVRTMDGIAGRKRPLSDIHDAVRLLRKSTEAIKKGTTQAIKNINTEATNNRNTEATNNRNTAVPQTAEPPAVIHTPSPKSRANEEPDNNEYPAMKKKKFEQLAQTSEPVRSREQFRVKLYPLTVDTREEDIRHFLSEYADPLSIMIAQESSRPAQKFAMIELASEQEVLSCLTRQFKPLLGVSVNIDRIFGSTVWATNYPLSYDADDLKNMIFELTGKHAVDIRLPSQRDYKERRFFYADFADDETAFLVKDKLAGHILEGHKIHVEISNPTLRKPRELDPASRQIHLHNLNYKKTAEDALRQYFLRWGQVVNVHLPLSDSNKAKGYLNNGFAFITFSSDTAAAEALSQKKANIDERDIDISAVKPKKPSDGKAPAFDEQKTITIQNLSATVTQAQLQIFLENNVGPVSQLALKPSKYMALVEFLKVADSGKAGIALEGVEYKDQILHVGHKWEYFQDEQTVKVPKMMPPTLMRRR